MRLIIKASEKQPIPELKEAVRRQVLLALSSYAPRIARITVSLSLDHSTGRAEWVCQLALQLRAGEKAVVTQQGETQLAAVSRSAARAVSWVRRQLVARRETQVIATTSFVHADRSSS